MLAPPLLWARSKTRLLSLFILNVFTLFVVTILKLIVSADFLSLVCPKCLTIRTNTVLQLFQEHKIVCNLRDLPHILRFQVTLQAITKRQNISINDPNVSERFLHFLAKGRRKKTSLSIKRNLTDSRMIVPPPRSNLP